MAFISFFEIPNFFKQNQQIFFNKVSVFLCYLRSLLFPILDWLCSWLSYHILELCFFSVMVVALSVSISPDRILNTFSSFSKIFHLFTGFVSSYFLSKFSTFFSIQ